MATTKTKKNSKTKKEEPEISEEIEEIDTLDSEVEETTETNNKTTKTKKSSKKNSKAREKVEVSLVKEFNIEDLSGVGPAIADKLKESGYGSVEALAVASPNEVSSLTSIGESTMGKIIQAARDKLKIGFTTAAEVLDNRKAMDRFTTGSEQFDTMIGGGVETKSLIEVYGEFRTGKTQIAHQLCVTVQLPKEKGGLEANAVYIDAEGTFRPERLLEIAEKYPELDPKTMLDNVIYARSYNSSHQQLIVDKLPAIIKENNIKLVVVDSIISHFRSEYIGRGTLADRQQKLNKFIHKLLQIGEAYNLAVFATNQVMASPGVFFGDPTQPVGGHVLAHASTYRIYLRKSKGEKRIARMVDSPCLPEREAVFMIYEHGIKDP
ncbi:MAG: DNA repair and recombination protein RadA [Candidatus Helarchaeota archaeon]|nr:DNA repair and recombination protein RadA [Candidatus Helarchaeota archaeon]